MLIKVIHYITYVGSMAILSEVPHEYILSYGRIEYKKKYICDN